MGNRVLASPLKEIPLKLYYTKCRILARLAKHLTGRVNHVNVQVRSASNSFYYITVLLIKKGSLYGILNVRLLACLR